MISDHHCTTSGPITPDRQMAFSDTIYCEDFRKRLVSLGNYFVIMLGVNMYTRLPPTVHCRSRDQVISTISRLGYTREHRCNYWPSVSTICRDWSTEKHVYLTVLWLLDEEIISGFLCNMRSMKSCSRDFCRRWYISETFRTLWMISNR